MTGHDESPDGKRRWKPPPEGRPDGGGRTLIQRQKVRKKKLGKSSREWLERHLNDPYVRRSIEDGYRARAAYKLRELDDRFRLIRRGARVIDLGCAPGGWTQVAIERGASAVAGVDLLPVDPIGGATLLVGDICDPDMTRSLLAALDGPPNLVLSDMAADTTGHRQTDHLRTVALAEIAARFAIDALSPGGAFVAKVFQGGAQGDLLSLLKREFRDVRHLKPAASRPESPETFVVATGFKA
jgi:23S rRNA (uridine2552-2'-O)-methyltransferase